MQYGLSKDIIQKAKPADIDISSIPEHLLIAMAYDPERNSREDVTTILFGLVLDPRGA
jgi:hypothetical protein